MDSSPPTLARRVDGRGGAEIPTARLDESGGRRYRRGMDGVRAWAVLAVLVYHLDETWLPGGFLGVDIFFVISGYLITDQLHGLFSERRTIPLRTFWVRRARRLIPAVSVVVVVATAAATVIRPTLVSDIGGELLAAATFTSNWWNIVSGMSYFAGFGEPSLFLHLWSLAVEEQFYLVWPVLFVVVMRVTCSRSLCAVLAGAGALASLAAMIVLYEPGVDASRVYYGTDTHAFGLLVGSALALSMPSAWVRTMVPVRRRALDTAGVVGAASLVVMVAVLDGASPFLYSGGFGLVTVAAGAVVVGAVADGGWFARTLAARPLRWIGLRSYGIYLWHMPVIVLLQAAVPAMSPLVFAATATSISFAAAALSYRWVEDPIRRHGFRGTLVRFTEYPRSLPSSSGRGVAVAVAATTVFTAAAGIVFAPPADDLQSQIAAGQSAARAPQTPSVTPTSPPAGIPLRAETAGPPGSGVTALGDSVMAAAGRELRERLPGADVDVEIGRQMWDLPDLVAQLRDTGRLGKVVVIGLGTNGAFDESALDAALRTIGSSRRVIIMNVSVPRPWQDAVNAALRAAQRRWPNTVIVDWKVATQGVPEVFWEDDTHPRSPTGTGLYVDLLTRAIEQQSR
ncbi:acyltransferase family protein [Rhodococcus sp. W8901]|uniref:acyltransferase family protein n=1 Tax=Rhodococcus sp. W8901 TaxID=2742603 RepID=UPI0015829F42|nr:acyltransferase family protein [Rhodococcus sp. W8901]QKT11968.1 acetyltransferase [Rhodococcus sp. W8901]